MYSSIINVYVQILVLRDRNVFNSIAPRAETRNVPVEIGGATTAVGIILSLLSIVLFVRYRSICRQRKRKQVNSLPKRNIVDQLVLRLETKRL